MRIILGHWVQKWQWALRLWPGCKAAALLSSPILLLPTRGVGTVRERPWGGGGQGRGTQEGERSKKQMLPCRMTWN